jgi:DNA polymerase-3 subunit alpha
VRNVGDNVVRSVIDTRKHKGRFASFTDFLEKVDMTVCKKRVVESLVKGGAFDEFERTRLSLVRVHEEAVDAVAGLKRHEAMGQFDLFGAGGDAPAKETSPLAHLVFGPEEWPRKELLGFEREMLGLYVSAHPLDGAEHILRKNAPKPIATLIDEEPKEGEIVAAGMISSVDRRMNKKGEPWAIVVLEDLDASIEVLFFPKSYSVLSGDLVPDTAVAVKGRVNWRDDKMSVFGSAVVPLDISDAEHNPAEGELPFVLRADAVKIDRDNVIELRRALAAHRGTTPVRLVLCGAQETTFTLDEYPVTATSTLLGELKAISGITVQ